MLGISFVLLNNVAGHIGLLRGWTPWIVAADAEHDLPAAVAGRVRMAGACNSMTAGLVLFADGARDARWSAPFEAVAARIRAAGRRPRRASPTSS